MWIFSTNSLEVSGQIITPPMPIAVDNALPGIELWLGNEEKNEVTLLCHMDTCSAMSTRYLVVNQWLTIIQSDLVAKYIQLDNSGPFDHL